MINTNSKEHNKKLKDAYRCYKPEVVKDIFPNEHEQANNVILSIAKLCDIDLDNSKNSDYYKILTVFSSVWIRFVNNPNYTRERVVFHLKVKFPEYIKTDKTAEDVADFILKCLKNPEYTLVEDNINPSPVEEEDNKASKDKKVSNNKGGYILAAIIVLLILIIVGACVYITKLNNKLDYIDKEYQQVLEENSDLKSTKEKLLKEKDALQDEVDKTINEIQKLKNLGDNSKAKERKKRVDSRGIDIDWDSIND